MSDIPALVRDLALILIVAGVVTLVFKKLKQPLVLGYVVAGFLVSTHMPYTGAVLDSENIHLWSDLGVYSGNTPQDGHKIVYAGDLFLPVLQFRALAAHELAHAWYVENGFTLVPDGKDPICEGFAQFVAWCLLKDMKAKFPRDNPAFVGIMGMFDEEIRGIEERGDEVYLGGFLKVRDLMGDARTASEWKKIMQKELKKETGKESGKTEKTSANPKQTKQTRPQTKKSGK